MSGSFFTDETTLVLLKPTNTIFIGSPTTLGHKGRFAESISFIYPKFSLHVNYTGTLQQIWLQRYFAYHFLLLTFKTIINRLQENMFTEKVYDSDLIHSLLGGQFHGSWNGRLQLTIRITFERVLKSRNPTFNLLAAVPPFSS